MERPRHYILIGRLPVPEENLDAWARWFGQAERHVGLTKIGEYNISTVFLGTDHNFSMVGDAILFETMIFTDDDEFFDYQTRCRTWGEAEKMHQEAIVTVKSWIAKAKQAAGEAVDGPGTTKE